MNHRATKMGRLLHIVLAVTLLSVVLQLGLIFQADSATQRMDGPFERVSMTGEYRVDGGQWFPLTKETEFPLDTHHRFEVRGNFSTAIEKNHQIMLRISDLVVRIMVEGTEVFTFGTLDPNGRPRHSSGNVWKSFPSPGITPSDLVEIELYNVYTDVHPQSINQFLDELYFGSVDGLYQTAFRQSGGATLVGFFIVAVGLGELIAALVMFLLRQDGTDRAFYIAGFATCSGIWFLIQYNIISLLFRYPIVVGTLDVLSAYLMSVFFALYVATYLTGREKLLCCCNAAGALVMVWVPVILVFTGRADAYVTISVGWPVTVLNLLLCMAYLCLEYRKKKSRDIAMFTLSLLPLLLGTLMDAIGFWTGLSNETRWLRGCFLVFVLIQFVALLGQLQNNARQAERIQRLENELVQGRISIMLSQIQPHFLYNSLLAIQQLCDENPAQAERAVEDFSCYLRGNLDALSTTKLITFQRELEHVKHYLALEQMRFGARLTVEYDIECENFLLPALTVQPLVENAVRYGVTSRVEGGTVRITTREERGTVRILISDDGLGFDEKALGETRYIHVGLDNVRKRLTSMCGGRLLVESRPGAGTTVTVQIPRGDDHFCG